MHQWKRRNNWRLVARIEDIGAQDFKALTAVIERQKKTIDRLSDVNEIIIETVRGAVAALPPFDPPSIKPEHDKKYPPETAVLDFSDAQIGSLVSKSSTGNLCSYNTDKFLKRIQTMTEKVTQITNIQRRGGIPVSTLSIHVLGDIVQGENVFPGQGFYLDAPLIEQVFKYSRQCIDLVFYPLAQIFEEVEIYCIPGNHGKQGRPGDAHRSTNWDYVVYLFWREIMRFCKHVKFYISAAPFLLYELYPDQIHALVHGNQAKGWMGFPYYGIDRLHKNLTSLTGTYISYLHHGHHHQPAITDLHIGKKIGNGSIEGGSEYSVGDLVTANTPQQFYAGFNKKGITWEYWLRLDEYPKLKPDQNGIYTTLMDEDAGVRG